MAKRRKPEWQVQVYDREDGEWYGWPDRYNAHSKAAVDRAAKAARFWYKRTRVVKVA